MRISVCEYLRLMTQKNWAYINPGHWRCGDGVTECFRVAESHFELRSKNSRKVKELTYFQGLPSNVVRAQLRRPQRRRS